MDAVAVILILLAITAVVFAVAATRRRGEPPPLPPGPANPGLLNQARPHADPTMPPFIVKSPPGFTEVARTGGQQPPPPVNLGAPKPPIVFPKPPITFPKPPAGFPKPTTGGAKGFEAHGVTQNMTAICKLYGKPASECPCEMHQGNRKNRKR